MIKSLVLFMLKRKFRKLYWQYRQGIREYDCSPSIAESISPRLVGIRLKAISVWDKIKAADPNAPQVDVTSYLQGRA